MPDLPPKLQTLIDDLSIFEDRAERVEALIDMGQRWDRKDSEAVPRTDLARIPGCESEVYILAGPDPAGMYRLKFAVDNPQGLSAMALAFILEEGLNGEPIAAVQTVSEDVVFTIFGQELSMGKSLGLTNMVKCARQRAVLPVE